MTSHFCPLKSPSLVSSPCLLPPEPAPYLPKCLSGLQPPGPPASSLQPVILTRAMGFPQGARLATPLPSLTPALSLALPPLVLPTPPAAFCSGLCWRLCRLRLRLRLGRPAHHLPSFQLAGSRLPFCSAAAGRVGPSRGCSPTAPASGCLPWARIPEAALSPGCEHTHWSAMTGVPARPSARGLEATGLTVRLRALEPACWLGALGQVTVCLGTSLPVL